MVKTLAIIRASYEYVVCGVLLACIFLATVFLFLQNTSGNSPIVGAPTAAISSPASSIPMVWYPVTAPTATLVPVATSSSSVPMIWYNPTPSMAPVVVSSSSSAAAMLWYVPTTSYTSSTAVPVSTTTAQ